MDETGTTAIVNDKTDIKSEDVISEKQMLFVEGKKKSFTEVDKKNLIRKSYERRVHVTSRKY